jgi:hypothetical protein
MFSPFVSYYAMDITQLNSFMSLSEVVEYYGQESIMEYYFGASIVLNKPHCNPFRRDTSPDCYFHYTKTGKLIFKDFAYGSMDCLDVASKRTGVSGVDLIVKIQEDFSKFTDLTCPHPQMSFEKAVKEINETAIGCRFEPMTQKDFDYWNSYGITKESLEKYLVKKVSRAQINGRDWYLKNNIDVCYQYINEGKVKLYRPFASKLKKFRNNYNETILPGYEYLPQKGKSLFITKAEKDMMTLDSLGKTAICLRSETSWDLPKDKIESLKQRFERIYVWLDADRTGKQSTEKITSTYDFIGLEHDYALGKDLSDIYKNHGKTEFKRIANAILSK